MPVKKSGKYKFSFSFDAKPQKFQFLEKTGQYLFSFEWYILNRPQRVGIKITFISKVHLKILENLYFGIAINVFWGKNLNSTVEPILHSLIRE